jgi:hypothetical protein
MKVTAEYRGVSYTFDPRTQAMKALGITEETEENRPALAKKTLEYMKTVHCRAETGAHLRWARQTMPQEELNAYVGRWKRSLIRRLTSLSNSFEKALMSEYSCLSADRSFISERISSGVPRYSTSNETTSSGIVIKFVAAKSPRTDNSGSSSSI